MSKFPNDPTAGCNASLAHRLAKRFDFSRLGHWLDFAGGSGRHAIAAGERHAGLRVTVKDHPNVVPDANDFIAKHNLQDRIDARPGDFLKREDYTGPVPSGPEYVSYLEAAGIADARHEWLLPNRPGQIEARKP